MEDAVTGQWKIIGIGPITTIPGVRVAVEMARPAPENRGVCTCDLCRNRDTQGQSGPAENLAIDNRSGVRARQ